MCIIDWGSDVCSSDLAIRRLHDVAHAEHLEPDADRILVEDAQHDAFAAAARQGGNADVEHPAAQRDADPAVLRQSPFGDVEPRHHLDPADHHGRDMRRSEEHTSELQSLMRISYAVFCLKKKKNHIKATNDNIIT